MTYDYLTKLTPIIIPTRETFSLEKKKSNCFQIPFGMWFLYASQNIFCSNRASKVSFLFVITHIGGHTLESLLYASPSTPSGHFSLSPSVVICFLVKLSKKERNDLRFDAISVGGECFAERLKLIRTKNS